MMVAAVLAAADTEPFYIFIRYRYGHFIRYNLK